MLCRGWKQALLTNCVSSSTGTPPSANGEMEAGEIEQLSPGSDAKRLSPALELGQDPSCLAGP
jgi:hypothetical protein